MLLQAIFQSKSKISHLFVVVFLYYNVFTIKRLTRYNSHTFCSNFGSHLRHQPHGIGLIVNQLKSKLTMFLRVLPTSRSRSFSHPMNLRLQPPWYKRNCNVYVLCMDNRNSGPLVGLSRMKNLSVVAIKSALGYPVVKLQKTAAPGRKKQVLMAKN